MFLPCFQLSFTCGILSIAKSSSTILWNHFVKKSEQSEENTNNQSAGIDACISLQRFLHFSFILALHPRGGGTLRISECGCAARNLEPLAYTRASFSWILLLYTRVNSWFP